MEWSQARGQAVVVRADAACALPALSEALERWHGASAIRLPADAVLERAIEDLLVRPRGRPSYAPLVRYRSVQYQAASWDRPRRVIAQVEHHLGELVPHVGVIATTLTGTTRAVVHFYNQRGTAEQWLALPLTIQSRSLTSLQQRLFKTGGRLIRHARYFILQLAKNHLTQRFFGQILGRIEQLAGHPA